jgi:hypothetical protein
MSSPILHGQQIPISMSGGNNRNHDVDWVVQDPVYSLHISMFSRKNRKILRINEGSGFDRGN